MNIFGYTKCDCRWGCDTIALYKLERWEGVVKWVIQDGMRKGDLSRYPGIVYLGSQNFVEGIEKFMDFSEHHLAEPLTPPAGGVL